jgi:hypothetical protein
MEYQAISQNRRAGNLIMLAFSIIIAGGLWYWLDHRGADYPPGSEKPVAIPGGLPNILQPVQLNGNMPKAFFFRGYTLSPQATYIVTARILHTSRYYLDHQSDISPVDLVLGWGLMSNKKVLSKISIGQSFRFYHWETNDYPIEQEQIESMSANTHIIPASRAVEKQIKALSAGDVATLGGYIVNVTDDSGFYWNTSTTRNDTGDGACEVFYVQYVVPQKSN